MPQAAPLIGQIALNLALTVGASVLTSLIAPKSTTQAIKTAKGFSFELQTGESTAVSAVLGYARARGQLIYHNSYGTDNEWLQIVVKVGHGWHDGLDALLINNKKVTLSGANSDPRGFSVDEFTVSGTPYMWVKYYTGAPAQTADALLVSNANPSDRWTSSHTMTGCAYYILTCRYQSDLYRQTVPISGTIWRGLRVFDWRDPDCVWGDPDTYVYSANPPVLRYNFRRGIYVNGVRILGQGFSAFACDAAGYTAAANRCDETFHDPETDTDFPVYEFGREVGDDESKLDVLAEIDTSYSGTSFKRGGADVPLPGQQLISVLDLDDGDRLAGFPVQADRYGAVSARKTMWHGQFVSADDDYQLTPYVSVIDTELEALIGGRKSTSLDQPYEWLQPRAQMRAEIERRRQHYSGTRVETFTPKALVLEPGDAVTRNCEWGATRMVVQKVSRVLKEGRLIGVTVSLREWNNAVVPASGESFVELPPEPGTRSGDPNRTLALSGFSITPFSRSGGGSIHPYGAAAWTQITDRNVDQVMIRVWPVAGTEAADKEDFFADAHLTDRKLVGPLQPLTPYTGYAIPIRRDALTTTSTAPFFFTTTAEVAGAVGDGTIDFSALTTQVQGDLQWLSQSGADFRNRFEEIALRIHDAVGTTDATFQRVRQELVVARGEDKATYESEITVAVGVVAGTVTALASVVTALSAEVHDPSSGLAATANSLSATALIVTSQGTTLTAHGTRLDSLDTKVGTATAGGNVLFEAYASLTDATWAAWGARVYASDGIHLGQAAIVLRATAAGVGQVALIGTKTVFADNSGNAYGLTDATGAYFNTAQITDLTVTNLRLRGVSGYVGIDADSYLKLLSTTRQILGAASVTDALAKSGSGSTLASVASTITVDSGTLTVASVPMTLGGYVSWVHSSNGTVNSVTVAVAVTIGGVDVILPGGGSATKTGLTNSTAYHLEVGAVVPVLPAGTYTFKLLFINNNGGGGALAHTSVAWTLSNSVAQK